MDNIVQNNLDQEAINTDEELAELSRKRDHKAFEVLMRRYMRQILNFSRQYAKTVEDADDIAQDTFLKVWKYIGKYTKGRAFRPWLYTIARNNALDHIKKKKALPFSDLDDTDNDLSFADTVEDTEPLASEIFDKTTDRVILTQIMESLHPDHKAILILHYHDNMTFDEIADVLGRPMNTVKSWHRRSLVKLKDKLHHYQQTPRNKPVNQ